MKVLVMGAGGQGAPCASILSKDSTIEAIKLCDIDEILLKKVKERVNDPRLSIEKVDASDIDAISKAAEGMDVIIDLVTPIFFMNVLKAALKAKVHYINTAWEEFIYEGFEGEDNESGRITLDSKPKLFNEFKEAGISAILGCGMSSGFTTNVLIRHYADKLDTMESVKVRLAKSDTSIPEEEQIIYPWNPGWNPKQALLDFVIPTYKFENGDFVRMEEIFAEPEVWEFPAPIGKQLVSHHAHEEPFCIPLSFKDKGLQYCDFKYYVNKQVAPLVAIGLGSEKEIEIKGTKIKPIDVLLHFVPKPSDAFLGENPEKFEYADKHKHVSIMVEIIGTKDGKRITYMLNTGDMNEPRQVIYDIYGTSSIAVALPAVIGAKMAVEGTEKGVIHPQDLDSNRFIELINASGYPNKWDEKMTIE